MKEPKLLETIVVHQRTNPFKIEMWTGPVPKVNLISHSTAPEQTLANLTQAYKGSYKFEPIPPDKVGALFQDIVDTKLGTPLEMLYFVFLINDVPRSWTHQAVRTRVGASYVQESTRFFGARASYKILVPTSCADINTVEYQLYKDTTEKAILRYVELLEHDVPNQEARQVLPHSILTHLYWGMTLKTLMGIYNVRWCCQAEPDTWLPVMRQMKDQIATFVTPRISRLLTAPIHRGESCGFNASFDRPCEWRSK